MTKFSEHEKSKYWDYEKNNKKPKKISYNSNKKFWFICNNCEHSFDSSPSHIVRGRWCPYCSKPPQKLCDNKKCNHCYNKSFASHEKAKYWSKDNIVRPREVFKSSNKKFIFYCNCKHKFSITLADVSNGYFCPYCSNPPKKLCENENCKTCFEKSFASHEKSKYFNVEKNDTIPRMLFKGSDKVCWFICENGHDFCNRIQRITYSKNSIWCQQCRNKTEDKLYKWLIETYPNTIREAKFEWCKNILKLPYDFYIPSKKILIELDGEQHFKDVGYWKIDYKKTQEKDAIKLISAIENDMYIIHIYQPDVLYDKINWKAILYYLIEYKSDDYFLSMVASDPKIYENYICEGISKLAGDD